MKIMKVIYLLPLALLLIFIIYALKLSFGSYIIAIVVFTLILISSMIICLGIKKSLE